VEAFDGSGWKDIATGTTIGYKRILKLKPVSCSKIRVSILESKACPVISNIEVY
jgi:alpha-L-fucosidase